MRYSSLVKKLKGDPRVEYLIRSGSSCIPGNRNIGDLDLLVIAKEDCYASLYRDYSPESTDPTKLPRILYKGKYTPLHISVSEKEFAPYYLATQNSKRGQSYNPVIE